MKNIFLLLLGLSFANASGWSPEALSMLDEAFMSGGKAPSPNYEINFFSSRNALYINSTKSQNLATDFPKLLEMLKNYNYVADHPEGFSVRMSFARSQGALTEDLISFLNAFIELGYKLDQVVEINIAHAGFHAAEVQAAFPELTGDDFMLQYKKKDEPSE